MMWPPSPFVKVASPSQAVNPKALIDQVGLLIPGRRGGSLKA